MLVLMRRCSESIIINDNLIIKICEINPWRQQVKLSFDAPLDYKIWREEIYLRIKNDEKIKK